MAAEADDDTNTPVVLQDEQQHQTNEPQGSTTAANISSSITAGTSETSNHEKTTVLENNDENKNNGGTKDDDDDDDIDSALARMMAIQEEEENGDDGADGGQNDQHDDIIDYDRNLGNNHVDDINAANNNNNDAAALVAADAVANNPAAIALRQRQALQHQRRQDQLNAMNNQPFLTRHLLKLFRPLCRYIPLSIICALTLLHHTLRTRQQFYLALVYVQSSKLSYIIFGNAIIALAISSFSLLTKLFLDGGLRPNERDAIGENIRWDVTETCLALTIFRSELDVVTAVMFLGLVVVKW